MPAFTLNAVSSAITVLSYSCPQLCYTTNITIYFELLQTNWEASVLFPTVITIADPLPLPDSRRSSNWASLINHRGVVFNFIPVEDSISRESSSIFPSPKYLASEIPCTLSRCQRSRASTPITASSIDLAAQISTFECSLTRSSALAFSVRNAEIAPDWAYPTRQNLIYAGAPVFWSDSLRTQSLA